MQPDTEVFNPSDVEFKRVSPNLLKVRMVSLGIGAVVTILPAAALSVLLSRWIWIAVAALAALFVWLFWLVPRQVRAIGYAEGPSDLLIRTVIMFRNLTIIPYGRLQYVDVSEGPIARYFKIAEVELHTASASTDASIPGLPSGEAARLRNELAARGEAEMAGL